MIEHIRESNLVEDIDDPAEDKISFEAWEWLKDQKEITKEILLELHRRITQRQLPPSQSGKFRTIGVRVGGYTPPAGVVAEMQAKEWLEDMKLVMTADPKHMHVRFEKIHPFVDGNGRTGRMLMWWHEIKQGKEPTLIRSNEADRHYYYQWFKDAE